MDEIYAAVLENIREIDRRDENQILAELAGEAVSEFIYKTEVWDYVTDDSGKRRKQKVTKVKLSWVGTREAARSRGNILISDPQITDLEDALRITVKATDLSNNFSVFGGCHQPKKMKINDYSEGVEGPTGSHLEEDPYCFQKGLSKAQRNALGACIPAGWAAHCIEKWLASRDAKATLGMGATQRYVTTGQRQAADQKARAGDIKPREYWDKITSVNIPDYATLERVMWDLAKVRSQQIYTALHVHSRNDLSISAWAAFLNLREQFCPVQTPGKTQK